jgi:hypothetical protein
MRFSSPGTAGSPNEPRHRYQTNPMVFWGFYIDCVVLLPGRPGSPNERLCWVPGFLTIVFSGKPRVPTPPLSVLRTYKARAVTKRTQWRSGGSETVARLVIGTASGSPNEPRPSFVAQRSVKVSGRPPPPGPGPGPRFPRTNPRRYPNSGPVVRPDRTGEVIPGPPVPRSRRTRSQRLAVRPDRSDVTSVRMSGEWLSSGVSRLRPAPEHGESQPALGVSPVVVGC